MIFQLGQIPIASFRELLESLGDADTLEAQSKAILMENDIRDEEFADEVKTTLDVFFLIRLIFFSGDQMFTIGKRTMDYSGRRIIETIGSSSKMYFYY